MREKKNLSLVTVSRWETSLSVRTKVARNSHWKDLEYSERRWMKTDHVEELGEH